jgi:hypothetical protein
VVEVDTAAAAVAIVDTAWTYRASRHNRKATVAAIVVAIVGTV